MIICGKDVYINGIDISLEIHREEVFDVVDGFICKDNKKICSMNSQNAKDYFCDDLRIFDLEQEIKRLQKELSEKS